MSETFEQMAERILYEIDPETKRLPPGFKLFATRLRTELLKQFVDEFEDFVISELGPSALSGGKMSIYDAAQKAYQAGAAHQAAKSEAEIDSLRAQVAELQTALAESQANDRTAMHYLSSIRAAADNDGDFPSLIGAIKEMKARIDAAGKQEPVAYLHEIVSNDSDKEPDLALSFAIDAFPLSDTGLFVSLGSKPLYTAAPIPAAVPDVDWLSNVIRTADGDHSLGAGALAEKIVEAMSAATVPKDENSNG